MLFNTGTLVLELALLSTLHRCRVFMCMCKCKVSQKLYVYRTAIKYCSIFVHVYPTECPDVYDVNTALFHIQVTNYNVYSFLIPYFNQHVIRNNC